MAIRVFNYKPNGEEIKTGELAGAFKLAVLNVVTAGVESVAVVWNKIIEGKKTSGYGYISQEDFDALDVSTVTIPAEFAGLEAEMTPTRLQDQLFRITEVVEDENYVTVTARHVWYDNLQNATLWKPTEDTKYTGAAACRNILTNAISTCTSHVASDCTDEIVGKDLDYERKNLVECFLDPEDGLCAKYGLSLIRNNWDFFCLKEVGYDRGFVVENGKNLLGVERKENIDNVVTRVAAYGKDEKGEIVWLSHNGHRYIDSLYINDYGYPRVEILDTEVQIGKDNCTAENIQEKILAAAQKRFDEDHADVPEVEMTIQFLSLGDTEEYIQYRDLDKVYLYDIISIKDTIRGYQYTAQVVGIEYDILTGMLNSVTIGKLDNWDGTRKIPAWQVPEISGENIRLKSIIAGSFAAGAILGDDIANGGVKWVHLDAASIDDLTVQQLSALTANIHTLIAGSITADDITAHTITADLIAAGAITTVTLAAECVTSEKIQANAITSGKISAGAITTEKLDAGSVTTQKLAAGAVTADKIDAGAINADKISTADLSAINAKLGTANIANAQIAVADINFAHIKDLNAESAYFGQAIFDEAVGGKLYVPRLAVGYAQMLGATIGDLVIQASNGNYYAIDVDADGEVTATQRSVTSAEISAGHTLDGKTLVLGTDILATDLNTENIYASHALMNEITAQLINVDQLWARDAFIGKLMTTDISSNTYIQATIGNWSSGSTITQTINSLDTRISELGYGTIFMQDDEPSHAGLVAGDVWIQTLPVTSWQDIYDNQTDYPTWQAIYNNVATWQSLASMPKMFVWDGHDWQEMYDSLLPEQTATEIEQLSTQISLRATTEQLDALGNTVTQFQAELTVQSQQIEAAVSAVNTKASSYVMWADPRTAYTVSIGDIWIKEDEVTDTWQEVYDTAGNSGTWQDIYDTYSAWFDLLGSATYVWNGTEWFKTSDRASEIYTEARITETERSITLMASQQATFQGELISARAQITVVAYEIRQEVTRAQGVENQKISKTAQYQTADSIVAAAEGYVDGILTSKAAIETVATGIVAYVADAAYQKQSYVEIQQNHVKIKSGGQFLVDSGNFKIDTDGSVIVKGAITSISGKIGGWNLDANNLYSGSGASYVALNSNPQNTYAMWAGAANAASAPFRVKRNGDVAIKGQITAESGTIGAWAIGQSDLHAGSGTDYVALKGSGGDWAMWAGDPTAANGKFRVKRDGTVVITKLLVQDPDNPSQTREVNLFSNFYDAAQATISGSWSGNTYNIVATSRTGRQIGTGAVSLSGVAVNISSYNPSTGQGTGTVASLQGWSVGITQGIAGLSTIYKDGWNDCRDAMVLVERYTRNPGTYGGNGTVHYVYDGSAGRYIPIGTGWYQTTAAYAYTKPDER